MQPGDENFSNKVRELLMSGGASAVDSWFVKLRPRISEEVMVDIVAQLHPELNLFSLLAATRDTYILPTLHLVLAATKNIKETTSDDALNLLRFVENIESAFLHLVVEQINSIAKNKLAFFTNLLESMKRERVISDAAIIAWASAYCTTAPEEALDYIRNTSSNSDLDKFIRVVLYINQNHQLSSVNSFNKNGLAAILSDIQWLSGNKSESYVPWQAICFASDFSDEAAAQFGKISSQSNIVALKTILRWIPLKNREQITVLELSTQKILLEISSYAINDENLIGMFDNILARLIYSSDLKNEALLVFDSLRQSAEDIVKSFTATTHAITENKEIFSRVLTKWLMSKDINPTALRSLLEKCITGEAESGLNNEVFQEATQNEKRLACARLIFSTHNIPVLCAFISDCAEDEKKSSDGILFAAGLLEYVVDEYPDYVSKFLSEKISSIEKESQAYNLYLKAFKYTSKFQTAKKNLPILVEFEPSSAQRLAIVQQNVRINREIGREAEKRSIFSQMAVNKVQVLQGKRVASVMPNGALNVSTMNSMSYSIELPLSERADPVGGMLSRIRLFESLQ